MENDQPVPSNPTSTHSRLGVIALILSLIPLPMAGLYILVFYLFGATDPSVIVLPDFLWLVLSYLPVCFSGIGLICTLVAIVLGVMSLFRREPRKWLAILAIVLSLPAGFIMGVMTILVMLISRT